MRHLLPYVLAAFMVLLGAFMLAFLPKATAFHAELQRAGKLTAEEACEKRKRILAGEVVAIALGIVLALMAVLRS